MDTEASAIVVHIVRGVVSDLTRAQQRALDLGAALAFNHDKQVAPSSAHERKRDRERRELCKRELISDK